MSKRSTAEDVLDLIMNLGPSIFDTHHAKCVEAIEGLASERCREQKEICAKAYLTAYDSENEEDAIRNAPEPPQS